VTGAGPGELIGKLNYTTCLFTEEVTGTVICGRYSPRSRVLCGPGPGTCRRSSSATGPRPCSRCQRECCSASSLTSSTSSFTCSSAARTRCSSTPTGSSSAGRLDQRRLAEFAAAAVPADPTWTRTRPRILASAVSDTGDDACLLAPHRLSGHWPARSAGRRVRPWQARRRAPRSARRPCPGELRHRPLAPGSPIAPARPGSRSSRLSASASDAGSLGGTSSPVTPPSTTSGMPPTRDATTAGRAGHRLQVHDPEWLVYRRAHERQGVREQLDDLRLRQHLRDSRAPRTATTAARPPARRPRRELRRVRRPRAEHELRGGSSEAAARSSTGTPFCRVIRPRRSRTAATGRRRAWRGRRSRIGRVLGGVDAVAYHPHPFGGYLR